jgi:hypothetical protein
MQLGKHVYVQKPMAHDMYEVVFWPKLPKKIKVVTQMEIKVPQMMVPE